MDFPWGEENLMKAKLFENLSVCRNVGKYSLWFLQVLQHKQLNARVAVIDNDLTFVGKRKIICYFRDKGKFYGGIK